MCGALLIAVELFMAVVVVEVQLNAEWRARFDGGWKQLEVGEINGVVKNLVVVCEQSGRDWPPAALSSVP